MHTSEERYREDIHNDVRECLSEKGGQPILFLGSGISRRYFGAPGWRGLLTEMANRCKGINHEFAYYEQSFSSLRHVGQEFASLYKEWAWSEGRDEFPPDYFGAGFPQDIFLKHKVAEFLQDLTPEELSLKEESNNSQELRQLQAIRPHAIVTTNYDVFLERLFPEYKSIIGQQILSAESAFFGEIFKIHGCVTKPETLVLTDTDYADFQAKKKYLSAKMLTFFLEHPVLLVGYSAEDPNIRAILSDIDLILATKGGLIPNIFLLRRTKGREDDSRRSTEELIPVEGDRRVRIRSIVTDDFKWVFEAFTAKDAMERIRPKLLRGLLARTYDLVRHDIPKRTLEVDYSVLERAVAQEDELAKLYGITVVGDATHVNIGYPFLLTQVGRELGYPGWHGANQLLSRIKEETGIDIKATDNKYHVAVKAGETTIIHKYSPHAIDLLKAIRTKPDEPIDLDME